MGAHTGKQFLDGLRSTNRHLYLEGERVDDVTQSAPAWGLATCSTSDFTSRRRAATGLTIICDRPTAAAPTGWSMVSSTRWTTVVDKNDR